LDRLNNNYKSNTPDFKKVSKRDKTRIKGDGLTQLSEKIYDNLNPELSGIAHKENTKMVDKKIVNNKPSQFGPILGVNFHTMKK
jgi:hypothetical protein